MRVGADFEDGTCRFTVWAPNRRQITLSLTKENQWFELDRAGNGYWTHTLEGLEANTEYMYRLDGIDIKPDPASHFQPHGVFGASAVVDHEAYRWKDGGWLGLDIADIVFYELHIGTFTSEGTFKATIPRIKELCEFGVNAVELMPIIQFSGKRNWGYDGVFPFAIQNTYGAPDAFKELVDECHRRGVALFVDSVYNHLGPEGNCLNDYGPYFPTSNSGRWGPTVNLDGEGNAGVRNYFVENALHWFNHYHIDGLRLDAILTMHDSSSQPFLAELNQAVDRHRELTGKKLHLIAETGYNVPTVLMPVSLGGFGFDAQWLDDFQHAVFALLTGEDEGYYHDYGLLDDVKEALCEAYVYVGGENNNKRKQPGETYRSISSDKFIVFSQNHDQVGNRLLGDRLTVIAGIEAAKLAAGIVLLSPYVPLIFMGEEYGETAPFLFFTDYQNQSLIENIREGRRKEFAAFHWKGDTPDPQSLETFEKSKLNWQQRYSGQGAQVMAYYCALIDLKKNRLFHSQTDRQIKMTSNLSGKILLVQKANTQAEAILAANFSNQPFTYEFPFKDGVYTKILDSAEPAYAGGGATLASTAISGDQQVIGGFNLAVYLKQQGGGGFVA